ncbi:MAG: flavodoxin family protein [Anaerolineaceae bacterium]|nr:flavodoxin family protein [Anaerolineaceae bacterium]
MEKLLIGSGHTVTNLHLRELGLKPCTGCWDCWVKTPGECAADHATRKMDREVILADFVLWAAPLKMGFPTALLKTALDKHLPLIHPYMEVDQGEAHHLKRYACYPRVGLLTMKGSGGDVHDLEIVSAIFRRTALNFKTRLEFCLTMDTPAIEVVTHIVHPEASPMELPGPLGPTTGVTIPPPKQITLFNGSPRGKHGNTPILLREFARGFNGSPEMHHLIQIKQVKQHVKAFSEAECAWIGFPLYTDAMPGPVQGFCEALEERVGRKDNPPLGFLVQSGFPEGLHSRYIERYLERLADRLNSPYLGSIVKGNGEGVRMLPPNATRILFAHLQNLGCNLANEGRLDPEILKAIARPERYPRYLGPLFRIFLRLPIAHHYFDNMLKQNSAFEHRYARPYMSDPQ